MILVLTGPVHSGKTSFLRRLLPDLRMRGIPVCGYLSPAVGGDWDVLGYDLLDVRTGGSLPFLRTAGESGWPRVGPYFILPDGLRAAETSILSWKPGELLIVDEVGPLEISGGGVWPALSGALRRASFAGLVVVRKPLLDALRQGLPGETLEVFDIEAKNVRDALIRFLEEKMKAEWRK
jgi:nucleoside-triphosphatase THEP1